LVLVLGLGALPIVAALLFDGARERREVASDTRARLSRLIEAADREQRALVSAAERELLLWSRDPAIRRGDRAACEQAMVRLVRTTPDLVFPTRIGASGRVDCGGTSTAAIGRDVSANPLFRLVMDSAGAVVGPYLRSAVLPEPLMPVNLRVTDDAGRPTGVLSVGVRMRWLADLAARSDLPAGTVITLLDETGLVIQRIPDEGWTGQTLPQGYTAGRLRQGDRGGVEDGTSFDNIRRVIAWTKLPGPPRPRIGVSASLPLANLSAAPDARLRRRLALLAVALVIGLLVSWFATGALVAQDVGRVAVAAERIGTGDFTVRTGVGHAASEVQQLAEAIDHMAARLGAREERALRSQKLESIGRLAGGIAHDFNNLLTAISGNVEDVRDTLPAGSPERDSLDLALDATRRSGALTRQLLAFSRRDAVQAAPLALRPVLDETAQLLRRTLGREIRVEVLGPADLAVSADRGRLEQAVLNLALNARDAMPGGGTLTLAADADPLGPSGEAAAPATGAGWVRLDVRDTGTGMSPEIRARLFEPFFTTKPVGQGTGLGLAMVYATVQQFGGSIGVTTAPGAGTTFSLWLPAVTVPRPLAVAATAAVPSRPKAPRAAGQVLLVDDEPGVRMLAARVLRREGYVVHEAGDGEEALRLAGDGMLGDLDALVTDLVMPRLGGVALAQALRVRRPDLPVVMITGYAGGTAPEAVLATERTLLLEKPFEVAALLAAVASVTGVGTATSAS
ncbi:MAG: ATP-binding protein, partial [Gemmatimonadaceae bacterium]|nr:ATP-binding protein [Gemmatimonadaceae bacterium]